MRAISIIQVFGLGFALCTPMSVSAQETLRETDYLAGPVENGRSISALITSQALNEERELLVWLPDSFENHTGDLPLVILFDGNDLFDSGRMIISQLIAAGHMPPSVLIALPSDNRAAEYTPASLGISVPDAYGEWYADFVAGELIPAAQATYRANASVTIVGYSQSAIMAGYLFSRDASQIQGAVLLDIPVHLSDYRIVTWLLDRAAQSPDAFGRLQTIEARFGWGEARWQTFIEQLPPAWQSERTYLDGESHQTMPFPGLYTGLRQLFSDYSTANLPGGPGSAALEHYQSLPRTLYGDVTPPEAVFRWATEDYWIADDATRAQQALAEWTRAYGESRQSRILADRITQMEANPLERRLESFLAEPFANPSEVTAFLGHWRGDAEIFGSVSGLGLDIMIENGAVTGSVIVSAGSATEQITPLDYLQIDGSLIRFGIMNGMRPRGLLLHEGELIDGRIVGEMRLAGVRFAGPGGQPMPPTTFTLERVTVSD